MEFATRLFITCVCAFHVVKPIQMKISARIYIGICSIHKFIVMPMKTYFYMQAILYNCVREKSWQNDNQEIKRTDTLAYLLLLVLSRRVYLYITYTEKPLLLTINLSHFLYLCSFLYLILHNLRVCQCF